LFTLSFLKKLFSASQSLLTSDQTVRQVVTDSRKKAKNSLFVPIIGDTFNGHDFIHQAIEHGAIAALWDETIPVPNDVPESFVFFFVKDTTNGLQQLAKEYRDKVNPIVVGITGSNGKTTTKDLVKAVVQTTKKTHATEGNFNNHIGLPLTILQMKKDTEVLVLEMGMNHFGEIDVLTKIAQPNYAIITNIGESHIEHLGSRSGISRAKLEIKNGLQSDGYLLVDGDEALLHHLREEKYVITCGFNQINDVRINKVYLHAQTTTFEVNGQKYTIPLLGKHHAKNAAFAVEVASFLQIDHKKVQQGFDSFTHSNMRFEWLEGKNNVSIINDAYNASPTSMKAAIEVVKQIEGYSHKGLVLGDILELGKQSKSFHRSIAETIGGPISFVFTFGEHAKTISDDVQKANETITCKHFATKQQLIEALQNYLHEDTLLLFKASRGMKLEDVIHEIIQ